VHQDGREETGEVRGARDVELTVAGTGRRTAQLDHQAAARLLVVVAGDVEDAVAGDLQGAAKHAQVADRYGGIDLQRSAQHLHQAGAGKDRPGAERVNIPAE